MIDACTSTYNYLCSHRTHPAAEQGRRQEDLRIEQLGFYMFFLQGRCKTVKNRNFAVVSFREIH